METAPLKSFATWARTSLIREVAARIAWSGVGVRLRHQRPTPEELRKAVGRVLADPSYAQAAQRVGAEIVASPGAAGFARVVDEAICAVSPVEPCPTA